MRTEEKNEEAIFESAVGIDSPAERTAFVKSACGDDAKLLARVEALLRIHYEDKDFLKSPPVAIDDTLDESLLTEGPGSKIGRYKLLQLIGEGGFGVVYMAEQERPIRRKAALKIIKLGMDTKQVIARFEAERQALAMMDHPNIAKVHDAGATDTGRPYFVMELVKGIPITEYCDKDNLPTRRRLELFIEVCKAVQHAHQKGIIHRDIKPSNVMVTLRDNGTGVPKIIDFGIAKATQQRLTEKTFFTEYHQFIGTPEYMSPEQAQMGEGDVDTRSDVYSLGVLLYELLTGTTPFEHKELVSTSYDEMRRMIRETDPPKPSTRLSTLGDELTEVAKHRDAQPGELFKIIRGDLDWVVMKTLEKDRTRRYETANELVLDIERHLKDEPVVAGPPSTVYRLRKFVRRNRAGVVFGLLVAATLVIGLCLATLGFAQASRQRNRAEVNFQRAREAVDEMTRVAEEQLANVPEMKQIQRQLLQKAQIFYAGFLEENADDPAVREEIGQAYLRLGGIHRTLGQHVEAEDAFESAIDIFDEMVVEYPGVFSYREDLADGYRGLADVLNRTGRLEKSEEPKRQEEQLLTELVAEFPAESRYRVALAHSRLELQGLLRLTGRLDEAEQTIKQAIDFLEECAIEYPGTRGEIYSLSRCYFDLGHVLNSGGRRQEAAEAYQHAVELRRKLTAEFPEDPANEYELACSLLELGIFLYSTTGRLDEAEQFLREAADLLNNVVVEASELPAKQWNSGQTYHHLGAVLHRAGRHEEAEQAMRQAFAIQQKLAVQYPDVPDNRADAKNDLEWLGSVLLDAGRLEESEQVLLDALEWGEKLVSEFPRNLRYRQELAETYAKLSQVLKTAGERQEAEESFRQAIEVYQQIQADFPEVLSSQLSLFHAYRELAGLLEDAGKTEEAEKAERQAQSVMENLAAALPGEPESRNWLGEHYARLARFLSERARYEEAESFLQESLTIYEELVADLPLVRQYRNSLADSYRSLGDVLEKVGRLDEAQEAFQKAQEVEEEVVPEAERR